MKWILLLLSLINFHSLFSQNINDSISIEDLIHCISINGLEIQRQKYAAYADSLNNYSGGEIPFFFNDLCIDWQRSFWEGLHTPMSIRWYIISKVTNKEALKKLLSSDDKKLHEICSMQKDPVLSRTVPMIELSYYELIKKRYNQLCNED